MILVVQTHEVTKDKIDMPFMPVPSNVVPSNVVQDKCVKPLALALIIITD
jgi:hypothetical protein